MNSDFSRNFPFPVFLIIPYHTQKHKKILHFSLGQYCTKIVRQMRRQIFRQMKQKAE